MAQRRKPSKKFSFFVDNYFFMLYRQFIYGMVICFSLICCSIKSKAEGLYDVAGKPIALLPFPRKVEGLKESQSPVRLESSLALFWGAGTKEEALLAREKRDFEAQYSDATKATTEQKASGRVLLCSEFPETLKPEGYVLDVPKKGDIKLYARDFGGFFNGLQTLKQLIVKTEKGWAIPLCHLVDEPAFPVRGVMLDVGRYYMSVPFIKQMVKNLAAFKINLLHLHLTDDPAWRLKVDQYPELTDAQNHWPTRRPGMSYSKEEMRDLIEYCASYNMRVLPEIDMPGHSKSFTQAMKTSMQSPEGMQILKNVLDEWVDVFPDPWFHLGADEVRVTHKDFVPEMLGYLQSKGKTPVVWSPGAVHSSDAIYMCWGENEAGHTLKTEAKFIDCNGFYLDWMEPQTGVYQIFFQQPCRMLESDGLAQGSILTVWCDGALSDEKRVLEQYPFYPCALAFAERLWRGRNSWERKWMAQLPPPETNEGREFASFERRLIHFRDGFLKEEPFAYVSQTSMKWKLIGPFDHEGDHKKSFEPETIIKATYQQGEKELSWLKAPAYGGAIHFRHLFALFNQHRSVYRLNHWPTQMSDKLGKENGTCYALTYVDSPKDQDVWLMFGLNGMWGHSGGYRSGRAPEQGSWDYLEGDVWLNDKRVPPPPWPFKSLPWGGWGKGRIEEAPLTQEGYFFRPPVPIHLKKGRNKILVKSVAGPWRGDSGECKWFFACMPVLWEGNKYREVPDLQSFLP